MACANSGAPAPPSIVPGDVETIAGGERMGWDQAASAGTLASIGYALYVDGVRQVVESASCDPASTSGVFSCTAPLPRLPSGRHTLALAAFTTAAERTAESARSASIDVQVATSSTRGETSAATAKAIDTAAGFGVTRLADGFEDVADLALRRDGTVLVAERDGRIRAVADGRIGTDLVAGNDRDRDGARLASLAAASTPDEHGRWFAYVLEEAADGLRLLRYRDTGDALVDRVTLLDRVPLRAGSSAGGVVRIGPDGNVFAVFDSGAEPTLDWGSFDGKLVRVTSDGSTPSDALGSPIVAAGLESVRGLEWDASGGVWVTSNRGAQSRLLVLAPSSGPPRGGRVVASYALPAGLGPARLARYRGRELSKLEGELLVGAHGGGLWRVSARVDPSVTGLEAHYLVGADVGPVRGVVVGARGEVWFGTSTALWRLESGPARAESRPGAAPSVP
ncbi:MAG: PQQ-dependent sugar dehydrogenase [Vicinamibacterales bacterium]